jgi:hypothetical protein
MSLKPLTLAAMALATGLTLAPVHEAKAWWACPTGYEPGLQLRNGNTQVRCLKPADTKPFDECPNATAGGIVVGTGHKRNYQGNRDKCVGYIAGKPVVVLNPTCGAPNSGYTQQVLPGDDRCWRPGGQAAPTRNVN